MDVSDLLRRLSARGRCPNESCCFEDIDRGGAVDLSDLLLLLDSWG